MIEITEFIKKYMAALDLVFPGRVWFAGLQGSYGRGEATEASDIDMVVILDRVWNLQKHGTAEVPALPADPRDYVRFYDGDIQVANFRNLQAHGSHGTQLLFF